MSNLHYLAIAISLASSTILAAETASTVPDVKDLMTKSQAIFKPVPDNAFPKDVEVSPAQIQLGHQLYFDPRLSKNGNVSCNSCHNLATYGVDNLSKSLGTDAKPGGRNPPTTLNAALNFSQFWDGRAKDVEEQAGGPLLNPVEMGLKDENEAVQIVSSIPGYKEAFAEVYGKDNPVSFTNITKAIAAYERTLITPSPFDSFLKGDETALNEQALRGLDKFINNGCIACHSGVNLGGGQYQKFGLVKNPYWDYTGSKEHDEGRFTITQQETDKFMFRVPTLRNVEHTYPYFHDGSVNSLPQAVKIMGITQIGKELPENDIDDIVAFLHSLTGELPEKARVIPLLPKSEFEKFPELPKTTSN